MRWKTGDKVRVREPLRSVGARYHVPGIVREISDDSYWVSKGTTVCVQMDYGPQPTGWTPREDDAPFLQRWIRYMDMYFGEEELEEDK